MFYLSLAKVTFLPRVLENELNSASGFPPSVGSERVARSRKCPPFPARRAFTRVACDVTADMSGVGRFGDVEPVRAGVMLRAWDVLLRAYIRACQMTGVSKSRVAYLPLSVSPGPGEREVSIGG